MAEKESLLSSSLEPLTRPLPAPIAGAIGQIVARHAYLEWLLGQAMYDLMEISIKQGRVILKLPRPGQYIAAVRDLYDFHGISPSMSLEDLSRKLDAADRARNVLARSTYMRAPGKSGEVILARSLWDAGPGSEAQVEAQLLNEDFLENARRIVETAVETAEKFQKSTDDLLRKLSERRRTQRNLDRRGRN